MNTFAKLASLKEEQLALEATMRKTDAHAAKCLKLGLSFKETYPDEYTEYVKARERYNEIEQLIPETVAALEKEQEEMSHIQG